MFQEIACGDQNKNSVDIKCNNDLSEYQARVNSGKSTSIDRLCITKISDEQRKQVIETERKLKLQESYENYEREKQRQEERLRKKAELRTKNIALAKKSGVYYVEYKVDGRIKGASVTYKNEEGGTEQHEVISPWTKGFFADDGKYVYISAQNNGDYGTINVSIYVNGVEVRKSSSSSEYGIASAKGIL